MKRRVALLLVITLVLQLFATVVVSAAPNNGAAIEPENTVYDIPIAPNVDYNMNLDWKFSLPESGSRWPLATARKNVKDKQGHEFYDMDFDDSAWETVSVPHTFNEGEIFDNLASGAGDAALTRCISFYRKQFTVDEKHIGQKVILELEGVRQAAYLWVNGEFAGYYEAGVNPFGFDVTQYIRFGSSDKNVIALALDSTSARGISEGKYIRETIPGSEPGANDGSYYQWNTNEFNPTIGGLTKNVILHVKNDVYQTLPLYSNLKTTGTYVYATNIDPYHQTAVINAEAEVRNESNSDKDLSLEVAVLDKSGNLHYRFASSDVVSVPVAEDKGVTFDTVVSDDAYAASPSATDIATVDVRKITASAKVSDIHLWSTRDPYLYDVYSILKDGEEIIDVTKITTGFRKVVAKGGVDGGIYINDELVWLTGYAQRSTNEWAAVGAVPDWLRDYDMQLVRESNANFIRWMHVAAQPSDIRACDKFGIACVQPAGDKEADTTGRQWSQRVETMRDTIIYFRNSPSILFWESGNQYISAEHMREMTRLKEKLDPSGSRAMGCRGLGDDQRAVDASEYVGTMLGRKVEDDKGFTSKGTQTRDKRAIVECEYYREESPRRVWDDYSPPDFDYVHGPATKEGDTWDLTAEDFVVNSVMAYGRFFLNRVGSNSARPIYSAAAALCWSDSIQHGRNTATENARMSGRVDPLRIKKQSFYAYQVLQSTKPVVYIAGHWNYPTDAGLYPEGVDPKSKMIYVLASNCKYVELFVNGKSVGRNANPTNVFLYAFPNVDITQSGSIEAVSYDRKGGEAARYKIETAGEAEEIRLTPVTGEEGLLADGSDLAYFDLEIVDSEGRVLPLDYSEIQLKLTGPATLRGGYNSGYSVDYGDGTGTVNVGEINRIPEIVRAECGTNRIMIRAGREAGDITLTASRDGLPDASVTIASEEFELTGGLTEKKPQTLVPDIEPEPEEPEEPTMMLPLIDPVEVIFGEGGNVAIVEDDAAEKKVIKVYVDGEEVDFGVGESELPLTAYEMAQSVFAPAYRFLEALGIEDVHYEYIAATDIHKLVITSGNTIVTLYGSDMTVVKKGEPPVEKIINQIAEMDDGVLHIEISAVANALGLETNNWSSGMNEFRVGKPAD